MHRITLIRKYVRVCPIEHTLETNLSHKRLINHRIASF